MNIEQRLNYVADRYRSLGFNVVLRPGPNDLPPFAQDFRVEILATGTDANVLASVKASALELEADPNVSRYAELTGKQPGWRFDLMILGPENGLPKVDRHATEPSEDDIRKTLDEAERMLQAGFLTSSLIAAWGALEAAMRRRIRVDHGEAGWGTTARTLLNELYSSGAISTSVLRNLEELYQERNAIVHGFSAPSIEPKAVQFLRETTLRLLTESQPALQTA
jgi:hypothetical protein